MFNQVKEAEDKEHTGNTAYDIFMMSDALDYPSISQGYDMKTVLPVPT